jgi:DNA (cytosine-5)-methyltransferase 1
MRVVDLFCGAGGTSLGFKEAGFEIHAGVDNDTDCCAAYRLNHGRAYKLDLLTAEGQARALELCREVDVVVGSPPCQGFSQCNKKRLIQTDPTQALPLVFARLVTQSKAQAFVLEETPLFRHTLEFKQAMTEFEAQGYRVEAKVLRAQDYGTPQRRHSPARDTRGAA